MSRTSYAAVWTGGGEPLVGSIVLGPTSLILEGKGPGRELLERIRYDEITSLSVDRSRSGRLAGRASLVLEHGKRLVRLATPETGVLPELYERLSEATQ